MFTQIKMVMTLIMVLGLAGAGVYVMKLKADNATLKANQVKLETAVAEQTKMLEQQKKDFNAIMESNKKLNVLINTFKKDLQDLDKRFTKKNRDIGKLALQRTKSIERIVNGGGNNAARCIELASGAEHTEAELKATLKLSNANTFTNGRDLLAYYHK